MLLRRPHIPLSLFLTCSGSTLIHVWGWERGRQGGDTREGGANRGEGPLAYSLLVCVNITSWAVWAQCTPSISVSILFSNMCNFRSGTELATKKSIYFNVTLHKIQTALFCSLTHTHTHKGARIRRR